MGGMGPRTLIGLGMALVLAGAPGCMWPKEEGGAHVLLPRYPPPYKAYDGEALPASEVATIETAVGHGARQEPGFIRTVNGLYMRGFLDGKVQIQVPPGTHTFGLGFGENGVIFGAKNFPPQATVTFTTEAGHLYRIHAYRRRAKSAIGSTRAVIRVEDVTTGTRIVG